jgi:hypothetical protein
MGEFLKFDYFFGDGPIKKVCYNNSGSICMWEGRISLVRISKVIWVEHVVGPTRNKWCTTRFVPWLKVRKKNSTLNWMVCKNMQERGKL